MKHLLLTLLLLNSVNLGSALAEDTSSAALSLTPPAETASVSAAAHGATTLSIATKVRTHYLAYFSDKEINYNLLSYILNQINIRPRSARLSQSAEDLVTPLPEVQTYITTQFLFMNEDEARLIPEDDLLDIRILLENILTYYTRYEATLFDARNLTSIEGNHWVQEGIIQMAAIELQAARRLPGIVDYDTLSLTPLRNDITKPSRLIEKIAAAFHYSATNVITFPLNLSNSHWILVAIQRNGDVVVIDSLPGNHSALARQIVDNLNTYPITDHTGTVIRFTPYKDTGSISTGLQSDGYQCGIHSFVYSLAIATEGTIPSGLAIIMDEIGKGKRGLLEDILYRRPSATVLPTPALIFTGFRTQLQALIRQLKERPPVWE